ncbi:tryptophan synthase beta subunit-like PLP-dependent enzyme [Lactifluus volemus]|nr:tryptophan synthase beta subunit-like PLP-dependent enzyme [Lactifluus volemus]
MPQNTPSNVARLGAKVVLHVSSLCPYDDPLVIARQGTVRMEILKQVPDAEHLDAIFGAVGGGGLVTGICEYVKRITNPCTRDIGAETFDGDAMARSLDKGDRVTLAEVCNSGREDVLASRLSPSAARSATNRNRSKFMFDNGDKLFARFDELIVRDIPLQPGKCKESTPARSKSTTAPAAVSDHPPTARCGDTIKLDAKANARN